MLPIKSGPMKMNLDPILANMLVLVEDALDAKEATNTAKVTTVMSQTIRMVVKVVTTPVAVALKTVDMVMVVEEAMVAVVTALFQATIGLTALATLRVTITSPTSSCIQKAVPMVAIITMAIIVIIMAATTVMRMKMPMSMTKAQRLMPTITMAPLVIMLNVALLRSIGLMKMF